MIATRRNPRTGRTEYRAYPLGQAHADGGSGAWYEHRGHAEAVHAAAVATDPTAAAMAAAYDAIEAHREHRGGPDSGVLIGRRNRALDALFALLTIREDGEQLTALANDTDLVDIVMGRQSIDQVNARRR